MDSDQVRTNIRVVRTMVKVGSAVMSAMGAIHCVLLYFEVDHILIHLLWCSMAMSLGIVLNRMFHLCKLHLFSSFYITSILVLMVLETRFDWTNDKLLIAVLGLIGFILSFIMTCKANTNC